MSEQKELSKDEERFCHEYIIHGKNGVKSALAAWPHLTYDSAKDKASTYLTRPYINARIKELQKDLEEMMGISKQRVVQEHMRIAFGHLGKLSKGWLDLKEFDTLTDDEKACIAEITKETMTFGDGVEKEIFRVKLHEKSKSLIELSKLLGYNDQVSVEDMMINVNIVKPDK